MKPPKNADPITLRWWQLTEKSQRERIHLNRSYRGIYSWRNELKIAFRSRLAVLRGALFFD